MIKLFNTHQTKTNIKTNNINKEEFKEQAAAEGREIM